MSAILLVPALVSLLFIATLTLITKIVTGVSLLIMVAAIYSVAKNKGEPGHFLILQSIFFTAFFYSNISYKLLNQA